MRWGLYLRKGKVFLPTTGQVGRGLYRDIEPVLTVEVSNTSALGRAMRETIARGNPTTSRYPRFVFNHPQPVVLKHAGLKNWSSFARGTSTWGIEEKDGSYQITGYRMTSNGWAEDPQQSIQFPDGTPLGTVIDRMTAILQESAKSPKENIAPAN